MADVAYISCFEPLPLYTIYQGGQQNKSNSRQQTHYIYCLYLIIARILKVAMTIYLINSQAIYIFLNYATNQSTVILSNVLKMTTLYLAWPSKNTIWLTPNVRHPHLRRWLDDLWFCQKRWSISVLN